MRLKETHSTLARFDAKGKYGQYLMEARLNWFNFSEPFTQKNSKRNFTIDLFFYSSFFPLFLCNSVRFAQLLCFVLEHFSFLSSCGGQWIGREETMGGKGEWASESEETFLSATSSHTLFCRLSRFKENCDFFSFLSLPWLQAPPFFKKATFLPHVCQTNPLWGPKAVSR